MIVNYKEKLNIVSEVLWAVVIVGAIAYYAWQHEWFFIFWIGLLAIHVVSTLTKYSNITFNNYQNIYTLTPKKDGK